VGEREEEARGGVGKCVQGEGVEDKAGGTEDLEVEVEVVECGQREAMWL